MIVFLSILAYAMLVECLLKFCICSFLFSSPLSSYSRWELRLWILDLYFSNTCNTFILRLFLCMMGNLVMCCLISTYGAFLVPFILLGLVFFFLYQFTSLIAPFWDNIVYDFWNFKLKSAMFCGWEYDLLWWMFDVPLEGFEFFWC